MNTTSITYGDLLRQARVDAKMAREQAARMLGCTAESLAKIEENQEQTDIWKVFDALKAYLNVRLSPTYQEQIAFERVQLSLAVEVA